MGTMRDLDQIREREDGRDPARTVVLAVSGLAAACVLFAAGVLIGRDQDTTHSARHEDPLARLDALAAQAARAPAPEVTFPSQLAPERRSEIDGANPTPTTNHAAPTTALDTAASASVHNPPPIARNASAPIVTAAAEHTGTVRTSAPSSAHVPMVSTVANGTTPPASAGSDGSYTLQVSSFRNLANAQSFAQRLRERGHRAFVTSAPSSHGEGTWHRVRIGPFSSLREVSQYRSNFESRERLPTFIVRRDEDRAPRR